MFLPQMKKILETEEGKREFTEWKAEQEKVNATQKKGKKN